MKLSQIRTVIHAFKDSLPEIFPGRTDVAKTIIFAKNESDADDIIKAVRKEFAEGKDFCQKVTYRAKEDPDTTLADFNNLFNPRIVVTVDRIVTGTPIKSLECLMVMSDVLPPVPSHVIGN